MKARNQPAGGSRFAIFWEICKGVADQTVGSCYRAENSEQPLGVFEELPNQIVLQKEAWEISVLFVALGALLAIMAVALSLAWHPLP